MVITASLFPAILNAKKVSKELYYQRLQKLYDLMVWMAIAIALPMTFLSAWIVSFLYGRAYSQASTVLAIHIWAGVLVAMGLVSSKWFLTENYTRKVFYITAFGALLNVIINIPFIAMFQIKGAAMATILSRTLATLMVVFVSRKLFLLHLHPFLLWKIK